MDEDRVAQPVLQQQLFKLANDVEEEGRRRRKKVDPLILISPLEEEAL